MNFVYQAKAVGLQFHKVQNAVEQGDYVILIADTENRIDKDAIAVYNAERELVGYLANSSKTLSINNRKNGNLSATELKGKLDFNNREYYGESVRVYSSCIYLEINEGKWSYINPIDDVPSLEFVRASELVETEIVEVPAHKVDVVEVVSEEVSLRAEISELKSILAELVAEVKDLKTSIREGGNSPSKPSSDRMLLSVVGLSHFDGQNHMDGALAIVEEPIFEGAKGTALYLKSGAYRVGVFPSEKKREYCQEHNIPYYENRLLKNKDFGNDIRIEKLVHDEYAIISV